MDTNTLDMVTALQTVTADPSIVNAFSNGLIVGGIIAAGCWGFTVIRTIVGGQNEET